MSSEPLHERLGASMSYQAERELLGEIVAVIDVIEDAARRYALDYQAARSGLQRDDIVQAYRERRAGFADRIMALLRSTTGSRDGSLSDLLELLRRIREWDHFDGACRLIGDKRHARCRIR